MTNLIQQEGYEAHAQNERRSQNPYLLKAKAWDDGWCKRQREQLIHRLESDKIGRMQSFVDFIIGSRPHSVTTDE